jgi:two-component system, NtrC family, response regulator AtoC
MNTILIVDDERSITSFIKDSLSLEGYTVDVALMGHEAIKIAEKTFPDIVVLDYMLPDMNGIEVLKRLRAIDESVQILMLTGYNSVPTALEAIRLGAAEYILKPFNVETLKLSIAKIAEKISLKNQIRFLREETLKRYGDSDFLLCSSPEMRKVYQLASQVALATDTTVLILGESGAGKEHIAKFIHHHSSRRQKPFVEMNCAAIPENLLESELFGYEPGAFTDARSKKIGLFEYADGGTLFLDEIGDMPLSTQAKVLKLIETKSFRRLGGLRDLKSNVRIVAATNKNLLEAIEARAFREDLYYRLQVVPIQLCPLRERTEDILQLAHFFLQIFSKSMQKKLEFSDEAVKAMLHYSWKGNVRELKNVVERATIVTPTNSTIKPEHLALNPALNPISKIALCDLGVLPREESQNNLMPSHKAFTFPKDFSLKCSLDEFERKYILDALAQTDGNQLQASKLLGIERHVLRYQMKKLGIDLKLPDSNTGTVRD